MSSLSIHEKNKRAIFDALKRVCASGGEDGAEIYAEGATCLAHHPVNELEDRQQIVEKLWRPLRTALPDLERRELILLSGDYQERQFVSAMGHLQGTFSAPLFDIPPTHGVAHIRYGEVHAIEDGRIAQSWVLMDMLDLMRQAGCWPIVPPLGAEGLWPGPAAAGGVNPDRVDSAAGGAALKVVKDMHKGLLSFDGRNLDSMDHAKYWTPDFLWYGPSGIGTTRGLEGFRAHHQIPFLRAFPDRALGRHITNIGDGDYVVTGGWPSVVATHTGPGWLGLAATGKRVNMRVMDFYRIDDGLIAENWVPIDIVDILLQLDVDVFERMRHITGHPRSRL